MGRFFGGAEGRVLVLLVVVVGLGALREPRLLQATSLNSILLWVPLLAVLAVGQMFVVLSRGIDVSVGSILGLSGIAVGMAFRDWHIGVLEGIALGFAIGCLLGLVNAFLIAVAQIPPIIATLGTLTAYRGLAFLLSGGVQIDSHQVPEALKRLSVDGPDFLKIPMAGGTVVVPWLVLVVAVLALIAHVVARHLPMGRAIYAVGSSRESALLHGVPVRWVLIGCYTVCGGIAGLAGVLYASRYGFVNPGSAGLDMELTAIAAVVIGGCDVRGGEGSVPGVVLGALLLGTINVGLAVLGIDADWQLFVYGSLILLALGLNSMVASSTARTGKVRA